MAALKRAAGPRSPSPRFEVDVCLPGGGAVVVVVVAASPRAAEAQAREWTGCRVREARYVGVPEPASQ